MTSPIPFPLQAIPEEEWFCSNGLGFAIFEASVLPHGRVFVTARRMLKTWFDATPEEQRALMALVNESKDLLERRTVAKPLNYRIAIFSNDGGSEDASQVVIEVVPHYFSNLPDGCVTKRLEATGRSSSIAGNSGAVAESAVFSLSIGKPHAPLWKQISQPVSSATEIDLLASFIQPSGLDIVQQAIFEALGTGANIRILVGDYLYITSPEALRRLIGWMLLATESGSCKGSLNVRLVELAKLSSKPDSFHPKAWRIVDASGGTLVVGSSNLSKPALETGVEWNLVGKTNGNEPLDEALAEAFNDLWIEATPLDDTVVAVYAANAKRAHRKLVPAEAEDAPVNVWVPRPWQQLALQSLERLRAESYRRALVAVATGLGKTWLAAFDVLAQGKSLQRLPRVLIIAHRAEILVQAEATVRVALQSEWEQLRVSWYIGARGDLTGDLVIASIQKLTRPDGLSMLQHQHFDYVVIDEVHHAQAPSYRRVLARLNATFTLGLTATPERMDGVDVASLFDDVLAWQASVGDGIEEGSLVPFHYLGIKDAVDFEQIPWRNGRFDPDILEQKLENTARMNRLWEVWQLDTTARTLVFCCSRRHALYTRDWLRRRGIIAAAVFSGKGGDPRSSSLSAFIDNQLQALCVVDLFNEGLDVPAVDRVVMLRPTESKVIFMQQLGRGLRAAEGKTKLTVIDFVGNHRIFASRLTHLLSLGSRSANLMDLKRYLEGGQPDLPTGCLLDIELEAKQIMLKLLPKSGSAVVEAYQALRDQLGRRPVPSEIYLHGYLPRTLAARYGSWFGFVKEQNDLTDTESDVLRQFAAWFEMLEVSSLNKSYKMVVLQVLLDLDAFWDGIEIIELAQACRKFLLAHPKLRHDLPPTKQFPDPSEAPIDEWAAWWLEWPLSRWMDDQAGRRWFRCSGSRFLASFDCEPELRPCFESMTAELVDYRLAHYTERRIDLKQATDGMRFTAKVSHASGKPILRLPEVEVCPQRPTGPTNVILPDGSEWVFRFVKIACNVAAPAGEDGNQIKQLMRSWFGENAGAPGTHFNVEFEKGPNGWSIRPVVATLGAISSNPEVAEKDVAADQIIKLPDYTETPAEGDKFTRLVPVFNLEAAAGLWGPESAPSETGWAGTGSSPIRQGMFIARVCGKSMQPRIPDGAWCLFRPCPAGGREGRILLVQFNTLGGIEDGGRFTVKKYHSTKTVSEDGWQHQGIELRPLNPEFNPIVLEPDQASDMMIIGEFVSVVSSDASSTS